jgi:hypothetical protein
MVARAAHLGTCISAAVLIGASASIPSELSACQGTMTGDRLVVRVPAEWASGDPSSPAARLAAARTLLATVLTVDPHVKDLMACALASPTTSLSIQPDADSWTASLSGLEATIRLARILEKAHVDYGSPSVGVEPLRPTSVDDQSACERLMSSLGAAGMRAVDAGRMRADRRAHADRAVADGLDGMEGREVVDGLDLDFVIRAGLLATASGESAPYRVPVSSAEAAVSMSLTQLGSRDAIELTPVVATARSRSQDSAKRQAEERALSDAAAAIASSVAREWIRSLDGTRPWILEIVGPGNDVVATVQSRHPELRMIEHRSGVRSLLEGPATAIEAAAGSASGRVEQSRPGYLRIRCDVSAPGRLAWWSMGVTAGLVAIAAAHVVLSRRVPKAATSNPEGR